MQVLYCPVREELVKVHVWNWIGGKEKKTKQTYHTWVAIAPPRQCYRDGVYDILVMQISPTSTKPMALARMLWIAVLLYHTGTCAKWLWSQCCGRRDYKQRRLFLFVCFSVGSFDDIGVCLPLHAYSLLSWLLQVSMDLINFMTCELARFHSSYVHGDSCIKHHSSGEKRQASCWCWCFLPRFAFVLLSFCVWQFGKSHLLLCGSQSVGSICPSRLPAPVPVHRSFSGIDAFTFFSYAAPASLN
jgi:hypothetical protein